ncbi:MAG: radical SAM protein, partial [Actinobacteria bacterium]|nr:radical SAM protein [Actinomycetota bacterium]
MQHTIGARLHDARVERGLAIGQLAEAVRLRPQVLQWLEADDFTPCGPPAYVRGYLRCVATYLDLPADDLVAEYTQAYQPQPEPMQDSRPRAQRPWLPMMWVNTCGFIESAKKDSIDALLAAADYKSSHGVKAVVAVGCFAQRYGQELAEALPEADAVLGFDAYNDLGERLRRVVDGERPASHTPTDRRLILPIAPAHRPAAAGDVVIPGHGGMAEVFRRRLGDGPSAPLKLASGCDRRCSFCAIPSFRGAFISRPADEVLGEAAWLADSGVKEVVLVSENTTSYGKDIGGQQLLDRLLMDLAQT